MKQFYFICAAVLIFVLPARPVQADSWPLQAKPWLLVAVPQTSGSGGQVLNISKPFRVILTNATNHNLSVWKEWCSWGYFNLSFEFTDKSGRVFKVEKSPEKEWAKNFPDGLLVKPGCAYTVTVNFDELRTWTGVEALAGVMTMKAIYTNTNEGFPGLKQNTQNNTPDTWQKVIDSAWVGQVQSKPIPVTIVR